MGLGLVRVGQGVPLDRLGSGGCADEMITDQDPSRVMDRLGQDSGGWRGHTSIPGTCEGPELGMGLGHLGKQCQEEVAERGEAGTHA